MCVCVALIELLVELLLASAVAIATAADLASGFERVLQVLYKLLTCLQKGYLYLLPCFCAYNDSLPDLSKSCVGTLLCSSGSAPSLSSGQLQGQALFA